MNIIIDRPTYSLQVEAHDDGSVVPITEVDPEYELTMEEFGEGSASRVHVFLAMVEDPLHFLLQEALLTAKSGIPNFMFDCVDHAIETMVSYTGFKKDNNITQLKVYSHDSRKIYDSYRDSVILFHQIREWFNMLNYSAVGSKYTGVPERDDWIEFANKYSKIQRDVFLDIIRGLLASLGYRDGLMGYRISSMDGSLSKELLALCHAEVLGTDLVEGRMSQEWYAQTDERKWQIQRFFKYVAKTAKGRARLLP